MTDRDRKFADEYVIDFDAKHAAIRAGYSETTARNASAWINPENPAKPKLRALIDRKLAELSRRTGVTAERVIQELAKIAFANADDIIDPSTGRFIDGVQRADMAAVAGYRRKSGDDFDEHEVKMYDKVRALELLGKRFGMFEEKKQITSAKPEIIDDIGADPAVSENAQG